MIGGEPEVAEHLTAEWAILAAGHSEAQSTSSRSASDQTCSSADEGYLNYVPMGVDNQEEPEPTYADALQFDAHTHTVQPPVAADMIYPLSRPVRAESNP